MRSMACCIFMAGCCDFVPDGQEFGLDVLEPFHDFEVEFGLGLVVLELLLGPAEGHSFFLDEVEDEVEVVDVLAGEESVSFFVFVGFDDVEFFFPEADEGGVDAEHFRHFADRVVEFFHEVQSMLCPVLLVRSFRIQEHSFLRWIPPAKLRLDARIWQSVQMKSICG